MSKLLKLIQLHF